MNTRMPSSFPARRSLAATVAALLGLSAPTAMAANSWSVTSCADDGGTGTLRGVISAASTLSGDIVDLDGLSCPNNTITLQGGYAGIHVAQDSLKIYGANSGTALTIDASGLDPTTYSAFYHTGSGTLTVRHLTITGGQVDRQGNALGGCIYSRGNVAIGSFTTVSSCSALSDGPALGGGIYAKGNVLVAFSTVTGNTASGNGSTLGGGVFAKGIAQVYLGTVSANSASAATGVARGGGVYANDAFSFYGSISGNHASGPAIVAGGGIAAKDDTSIQGSTISGNSSSAIGGGIYVANGASLANSTVSGNSAGTRAGALYAKFNSFFYNSTIAFNTSGSNSPGVLIHATNAMNVVLQSTLISNNAVGTTDDDFAADNAALITFNSGPANNLVRVTNLTGLPADTKSAACPLLGPLRDNGGLTKTHQLMSTSAAIDAGNDVTINPLSNPKQPFANDQRGPVLVNGVMDYLRVSGPSADIGAYEVQKSDIVFGAAFDGCNPP